MNFSIVVHSYLDMSKERSSIAERASFSSKRRSSRQRSTTPTRKSTKSVKSVAFDTGATAVRTFYQDIDDPSEVWCCSKDYQRIKAENFKTVMDGRLRKDKSTLRGLETAWMPLDFAIECVLQNQDKYDDQSLGQAYSKFTKYSLDEAIRRAKGDEAAAKDIHDSNGVDLSPVAPRRIVSVIRRRSSSRGRKADLSPVAPRRKMSMLGSITGQFDM